MNDDGTAWWHRIYEDAVEEWGKRTWYGKFEFAVTRFLIVLALTPIMLYAGWLSITDWIMDGSMRLLDAALSRLPSRYKEDCKDV